IWFPQDLSINPPSWLFPEPLSIYPTRSSYPMRSSNSRLYVTVQWLRRIETLVGRFRKVVGNVVDSPTDPLRHRCSPIYQPKGPSGVTPPSAAGINCHSKFQSVCVELHAR